MEKNDMINMIHVMKKVGRENGFENEINQLDLHNIPMTQSEVNTFNNLYLQLGGTGMCSEINHMRCVYLDMKGGNDKKDGKSALSRVKSKAREKAVDVASDAAAAGIKKGQKIAEKEFKERVQRVEEGKSPLKKHEKKALKAALPKIQQQLDSSSGLSVKDVEKAGKMLGTKKGQFALDVGVQTIGKLTQETPDTDIEDDQEHLTRYKPGVRESALKESYDKIGQKNLDKILKHLGNYFNEPNKTVKIGNYNYTFKKFDKDELKKIANEWKNDLVFIFRGDEKTPPVEIGDFECFMPGGEPCEKAVEFLNALSSKKNTGGLIKRHIDPLEGYSGEEKIIRTNLNKLMDHFECINRIYLKEKNKNMVVLNNGKEIHMSGKEFPKFQLYETIIDEYRKSLGDKKRKTSFEGIIKALKQEIGSFSCTENACATGGATLCNEASTLLILLKQYKFDTGILGNIDVSTRKATKVIEEPFKKYFL